MIQHRIVNIVEHLRGFARCDQTSYTCSRQHRRSKGYFVYKQIGSQWTRHTNFNHTPKFGLWLELRVRPNVIVISLSLADDFGVWWWLSADTPSFVPRGKVILLCSLYTTKPVWGIVNGVGVCARACACVMCMCLLRAKNKTPTPHQYYCCDGVSIMCYYEPLKWVNFGDDLTFHFGSYLVF